MFRKTKAFLLKLIVFLSTLDVTVAWPEPPRPHDGELVQKSEWIVIGHAKDISIERPILVIAEILKGQPLQKEVPILLHDQGVFLRFGKGWQPNSGLTIWEGGSMPHPICGDISQDQIWFLRTDPKTESGMVGEDAPRVMEPGDVQPIELKPYYVALLSTDPEKTLQKLMATNSSPAERARGSLDFLAIKQIEKVADPEKRIDLLMPYFLAKNGDPANMRDEAIAQIETCGPLGAKKLESVFFEIKPAWRQILLMGFWQQLNYRDAVPTVIRLLDNEDRFWSRQDMNDKSWYPNVPGDLTMTKNDSFNKIYCAIRTLIVLGGGQEARSAVIMTRNRWISHDPTGAHELIRFCDEWLAANKQPN